MPTTIADIATWVTTDYLNRADLTASAQNAALFAYRLISRLVPFDENFYFTTPIPLVANQGIYDLSTLVVNPDLLSIEDIQVTIAPQYSRRLRQSSVRLYDSLSIVQPGLPSTYARAAKLTIQLNPPPDQSTYTMQVRYWAMPAEASPIEDTVLTWPVEWDELLRWETAYRVLNLIGQEQRAMMLVAPSGVPPQSSNKTRRLTEVGLIPRLWNDLLKTRAQRENVDSEFSMNPVIRSYSIRP